LETFQPNQCLIVQNDATTYEDIESIKSKSSMNGNPQVREWIIEDKETYLMIINELVLLKLS
jgi:hypothetical protein